LVFLPTTSNNTGWACHNSHLLIPHYCCPKHISIILGKTGYNSDFLLAVCYISLHYIFCLIPSHNELSQMQSEERI